MTETSVHTTEIPTCSRVCQYRFLIGWMAGSEGADGEDGIEEPNDLLTGKVARSEYHYELSEGFEDYAWKVGAAFGFLDDYTATNTMSRVQKFVNGDWCNME